MKVDSNARPGRRCLLPWWTGLIALVLGIVAASPAGLSAQVDLVLNLTDSPDPVAAGGVITYSTTVNNDGLTTATGVQFTLDVPANATYEGFTGAGISCSGMTVGALGPGTVTCSLPDLPNAATAALTVQVGSTASGSVIIQAQTSANEADAQPANNSVTETTTVTAGANVALSMTGPATGSSGSTINHSLTLSNAGPDAASALEVQFPVPSGLLSVGSLPAGCSLGGSTITCTVSGPIASGGFTVIGPFSWQISAGAGSTITASASVQVSGSAPFGTPQDPDASDNTAVFNTTVTAGSDVRVTVSRSPSSGSYFVGGALSLVLTAAYTGDSPSGLSLVDLVPGQYTIDTGSFNLSQNGWTCSVAGQQVTCTRPAGGAAGANQSLGSISIPVIVATAGVAVTNSATISAASPTDPDLSNNSDDDGGATLLDPAADLSVTKSAPSPALVVQGVPFNFALSARNNGPSVFSGTLIITDQVPAGLTVNSYTLNGWSCAPAAPVTGPANIDCQRTYTSGSPLASGSTTPTFTLNATATVTGGITNSATLSTSGASVPDNNAANNTTSATVTSSTVGASADLTVAKVVDLATVPAGEVLTYTLEVVNLGPTAAGSVTLTDNLTTLINNAVGATGAGYVGHTITENAAGPGGVTCSTASTGSTSRRLTCTIPTLPVCTAGVDCPTIDVAIRPGGNGGSRTNTGSVVSSATADPVTGNNSGSVTSTVDPRADVTISKTATPDPSPSGQEVVFVVTALNNGPSQAANVTVTDDLPLDMVFVSASPSAGSCSVTPTANSVTAPGNRQVVCNLGSINNGAQRTLTIRAKPTNVTRGTTLTNNASVSTTTTEPTVPGSTNNTATANVTVNNPSLDILVNNSDTVDPVAIGDATAYTVVVTNVGPSDAENVVINNTLPPGGLSYQSVTFPAGSCATTPIVGAIGGTVVCSIARLSAGGSATLTIGMQGEVKGVYTNNVSVATDETGLGFEDGSNNTSDENTTVRTRADVQVVSVVATPNPVAVRRPFNWAVQVRNNAGAGLSEADNVTVTDNLPSGLELTGAPTAAVVSGTTTANTCTGLAGGTSFTCDLGTVSSGAVVDITVPVRSLSVPPGGTATNSASVTTSSLDVVPANNSNNGVVTIQGSTLTGVVFRDFDADGVQDGFDTGIAGVTMTLAGTAFDASPVSRTTSTNGSGVYTFSDLPEGTYTIQRGAVSEPHLVVGQQTAGNRGGSAATLGQISAIALGEIDSGSGYLFAYVPQARVGVAKRVASGPTVAADSSYTAELRLVVENPSLEDLALVSVTDPLAGAAPALGSFVAGGAAATLAAGQYTVQTAPAFVGACVGGTANAGFDGDGTQQVATIATLSVGATCELSFTVRFHPVVPLPVGGYENQAAVSAVGALSGQTPSDLSQDGSDPDPDANGDPTDNDVPTPLTPTLVADVTTVVTLSGSGNAGTTVTGTVLFTNNGPFTAAAVTYTLTLAANLSGVSFSNLPGGAAAVYNAVSGQVTFTGMPGSLTASQIASGDGSTPIGFTYEQSASGTSQANSVIATSTSQGANTAPDSDADILAGVGSAAIGAAKNGGLSGNTVTYDVTLENLSFSTANSVSVPDDLDSVFGAGNYTVVQAPTLTTAPATGSLTVNAAYTGSGGNVDLIDQTTPLSNTMVVGDIAVIRFRVLIINVTDQGHGLGVYHNQVTTTALAPGAVGPYTDVSVDGSDPDANSNGTASDDASPTIVALGADATIGVAKAGSLAGDTVTYDFKLRNTGNAVADSIQLTDDLDATFGAGNFQVLGPPLLVLSPLAGSLTLAGGFTGVAPNHNLLATSPPATNTLPPGDSATVRVRVQVTNVTDRGFGLGTFHNSASTRARGPGAAGPYLDTSVDGTDVDPNSNGDPTDDTSPTIVSVPADATVGVAKSAQVSALSVIFQVRLENTGNAVASAVSVTDDLDLVFGAGNYTLNSAPVFVADPGTLTLNAGYTGSGAATELIDQTVPGANILAPGTAAVIQFGVTLSNVVDMGSGWGVYANQAHTSALGPAGTGPFTDDSQNGGSVDPDGDGDPTNNSVPTPVVIQPSDLVVTKSGPATAQVGDTITYVIAVTNAGPGTAVQVQIQDVLPSGVTFVGATGGASLSGVTITWPVVTQMTAGAVETREVRVATPAVGTWENVARASSPTLDPTPSNNNGTAAASRSTVVVEERGADLVVTKTGPATALAGDTVTYVVTTRNDGPADADAVVVSDSLPAGAVFVAASRGGALSAGQVRWPALTRLTAGASVVDSLRVVLPSEGTWLDIASATSANPDPDPTNNDGSTPVQRVTTVTQRVDVSLEKRLLSATLAVGGTAQYELIVSNVGSVPTQGPVTVVDTLPAALSFQSATGLGWTCADAGQVVTCSTPGPLPPGESSMVSVSALVIGASGESVVNTATVSTLGDTGGAGNNTGATLPAEIQPLGELRLEKRVSSPEAEIGDLVTYELTLRNVGAGPVTEVVLSDRLPTGFSLVAGSVVVDGTSVTDPVGTPGPLLELPLGDLPAGSTVRISYRVRVGVGAELGDGINRAVGSGSNGLAASNEAVAAVGLRKGVFTDEGLILGRVWVDPCDCVPTGAFEEPVGETVGVPGVRVYLQDGTSALTDREGRYSFDGLPPRHWLVRVDERTLPAGMRLSPLTTRHLASGSSKLVDLTRGEMARADFGDPAADSALVLDVMARAALGPVPDLVVPSAMANRAGTSMRGAPGPWSAAAMRSPHTSNLAPRPSLVGGVRPVEGDRSSGRTQALFAPLFRRPGSTSGMALDASANAHGTSDAAAGMRSGDGRLGVLLMGFVEGRIDWRSLADGELLTPGVRDRFQDALEEVSTQNAEGTLTAGARAAAFATGEVGDGYQVTLRVDTEKDRGRRFFNDIRPDELYDVFGDASPRLFEAQSKGRVFGALGRGDSYVLYGDFNTASYDPASQLGRYARTLSGALQQYSSDRMSLRTFASRDRFQQVVDELPALGISGPYALSRADGLLNSERVELVTRDRTQPGVILDVVPLQRFTDYTIEPFSGRLIFKRPIPSVDERLNPISIRVTYESETGGARYWVYGAEGQLSPSERLSLGGSAVRSDDPSGRFDLASAHATLGLGEGTWLSAEVARSDSAGAQNGVAWRAELVHRSERAELRAFVLEADSLFQNVSAGVAQGRTEMGLTGRTLLSENVALFAEAVRSEDARTDGVLTGGRVALARKLSERWSVEVGFRHASEDRAATAETASVVPNDVNAVGLRLEGAWSERGTLYAEMEQDVQDTDARRVAVGGDLRVAERARLYAQHELISSLAGPYSLNAIQERNRTVFGVSADYREGQSVFSEYRVGDRLNGREAHAAIGLRNQWSVKDGVRLSTSFERVRPVSTSVTGPALAVTGALEWATSPLWKGAVRGELRATETSDQVLGTLGFARRLTENSTALVQSALTKVLDGGAFYERTRLGLAYRGDGRSSWNLLARYEHRTDDDPFAAGGPLDHRAHVFSSHVNVRPADRLTVRGEWAAKRATDIVGPAESELTAQLLAARATWDLTSNLDMGAIGRTLSDEARRQFGLGAELGVKVSDGLRLSVGYNWFGFRDDDLGLDQYTDKGLFVDLSWRFDEATLGLSGTERRVGERARTEGTQEQDRCRCTPPTAPEVREEAPAPAVPQREPRAAAPAPVPEETPEADTTQVVRTLVVPNVVHFAFDRAELDAASRRVLDEVVAVLEAEPLVTVALYGHTDVRGSDDYNAALGQRRARAVREYLVAQGIAPARLREISRGEGENYRLATEEVGHALNRRVELLFFMPDGLQIEVRRQEGDLKVRGRP
ncbi:MAG: SdrD B-like domain-containing protein [Gemmatimonadota bacterium]